MNAVATDPAPVHSMTPTEAAAMLQARALCIQAALMQRREAETPEQIIARAEVIWGWVSKPLADNPEAGRLAGRKRPR